MSSTSSFGIVGMGLIGGSIARALTKAYPNSLRLGLDHDPSVTAEAASTGVITQAAEKPEVLSQCEMIFVAVPLEQASATLKVLSHASNATLIDVASVKSHIVAVLAECARPERIVLTHPMAGKEYCGFSHSEATLFEGKNWLVCRHSHNGNNTLMQTEQVIRRLGAVVRAIPLDKHDRLVARTSHLPQLLATLLAAYLNGQSGYGDEISSCCGTGVKSMTRLAGSPYGMWQQVFRLNAVPIQQALREYLESGAKLQEDSGDAEVKRLFAMANEFYQSLHRLDG